LRVAFPVVHPSPLEKKLDTQQTRQLALAGGPHDDRYGRVSCLRVEALAGGEAQRPCKKASYSRRKQAAHGLDHYQRLFANNAKGLFYLTNPLPVTVPEPDGSWTTSLKASGSVWAWIIVFATRCDNLYRR
jgi:hypothetical protein